MNLSIGLAGSTGRNKCIEELLKKIVLGKIALVVCETILMTRNGHLAERFDSRIGICWLSTSEV